MAEQLAELNQKNIVPIKDIVVEAKTVTGTPTTRLTIYMEGNVAKTGYKPLAIVGWNDFNAISVGYYACNLEYNYITGNTAKIAISDSTQQIVVGTTRTLTVYVLYVKE